MSAHPDKCKTISKLVYFCKSTNEILGKKNHLFRLKNRNSMLTHHVTIDYYAHLADREWRTYILVTTKCRKGEIGWPKSREVVNIEL